VKDAADQGLFHFWVKSLRRRALFLFLGNGKEKARLLAGQHIEYTKIFFRCQ